MDHQDKKPIPTSILEYRAVQVNRQPSQQQQQQQQQQGPSSQPVPQFSTNTTLQRPVAYPHGYPTPPPHPSALSPVNDLQSHDQHMSQNRTMTPQSTPADTRPNPTPLRSYSMPLARQSGLQSPPYNASAFQAPQLPIPTELQPQPQASTSHVHPSQGSSAYGARPFAVPSLNSVPISQGAFGTSHPLSQPAHPRPLRPHPDSTAPLHTQAMAHMRAPHPPHASTSHAPSGPSWQQQQQQQQPSRPPQPPHAPLISQLPPGAYSQTPPHPHPHPPYTHTSQPGPSASQPATQPPHPHPPNNNIFHPPSASAWADYTRTLERRAAHLEAHTHELAAANARLVDEQTRAGAAIRDLRARLQSAQEAGAALATRARGECTRLRAERDALAANAPVLMGVLQEQADAQAVAARERAEAGLRAAELEGGMAYLAQRARAGQRDVERLRGERDALRARLAAFDHDSNNNGNNGNGNGNGSGDGVVEGKQVRVKPDPDVKPKSEEHGTEPELELQYPPTPGPGPGPSGHDGSSSSTFVMPGDRKRSRTEYEADFGCGADADGDAVGAGVGLVDPREPVRVRLDSGLDSALELQPPQELEQEQALEEEQVQAQLQAQEVQEEPEPPLSPPPSPSPSALPFAFAFPLRGIDVKGLNSPVRYFMEVRRRERERGAGGEWG
ncbi:hypothetical protein K438DRAFT_2023387 [Mycena galopus ATCC 62051]|nr:hypothetical protein K438DRAFT_2023387 [Mycena galopus ATCC 62051]